MAALAAPVPAFCRRGTALVVVEDDAALEADGVVFDAEDVEDDGRPARLLLLFFGDDLEEPPSFPFLLYRQYATRA